MLLSCGMVKEVTGGTSPFTRPALSVPNIFLEKLEQYFLLSNYPVTCWNQLWDYTEAENE